MRSYFSISIVFSALLACGSLPDKSNDIFDVKISTGLGMAPDCNFSRLAHYAGQSFGTFQEGCRIEGDSFSSLKANDVIPLSIESKARLDQSLQAVNWEKLKPNYDAEVNGLDESIITVTVVKNDKTYVSSLPLEGAKGLDGKFSFFLTTAAQVGLIPGGKFD